MAKATLSKGRKSLCVIFRHPVRKDGRGNPLRVRRGLGTQNAVEAQKLIDMLNEIIEDEKVHTPAARAEMARKYPDGDCIIRAFYDDLPGDLARDPIGIRDDVLPLPGRDAGYVRVLLLGSVGAGKTTLVRQLLGTDQESERFPSTATARTTLFPMEFVLGAKDYEAVATFMPEHHVRLQLEECLQAAAREVLRSGSDEAIAKALLDHPDNVFRLSYVLGSVNLLVPSSDAHDDDNDDLSFFGPAQDHKDTEERAGLRDYLLSVIDRIRSVARQQAEKTATRLGTAVDLLIDKKKRQEFEEDFEFDLQSSEEFSEIADDIMDQIAARFSNVKQGEFSRDGDWPTSWSGSWSANDRTTCIDQLKFFSSNNAPDFGKLLTPLVSGMRVSGPFSPPASWGKEVDAQIVLLDGVGLGHTSESSQSLSTSITSLYDRADVILLVDDAQSPMGYWPRAVINGLVSSGHDYKVVVAFTHFDMVSGDNMPTDRDKARHLQAAVKTAIRTIGSRRLESEFEAYLKGRVVFLANIHQRVEDGTSPTAMQLRRLIALFDEVAKNRLTADAMPIYDGAQLRIHVARAVQAFHDLWLARLGIEPHSDTKKEHWTRIKALTHRLGLLGLDEYDSLKPVADLADYLQGQVRDYLEHPVGWRPADASEDEQAQAKRRIANHFAAKARELATRRILQTKTREWQLAHQHRGTGSATKRAYDLRQIYAFAAPQPVGALLDLHEEFVSEFFDAVAEAIRKGNGICRGVLSVEGTE